MNKENLTIALLIDTENVSANYMEDVEQKLIALGKVTYKRMYGDFTNEQSKGWKELVNEFSLQPVQQYSYTTGKNATDSKMIIDAMDILYSGNVNAVCIMSSDSDFTGLVKRLKESNIYVIGAGEEKTPQSFVKACDRFLILGGTAAKKQTAKKTVKKTAKKTEEKPEEKPGSGTVTIARKSTVEKFVREILESKGGESCSLEWVITKIYQRFPQFDFKDYRVKKSYEFFDKTKFELTQVNGTNWLISLK